MPRWHLLPGGPPLLAGLALLACSSGENGAGAPSGASPGATAPAPSASPATSASAAAPPTPSTPSTPATAAAAPSVSVSGCPNGMAKIEGAKFKMGTADIANEKPVHEVMLATFCMDRTEVTSGAYEACVKAGGCQPASTKRKECTGGRSDRVDHPINCVDWQRATTYCAWADRRLPTEEEWELAAGGVERRLYPWGNKLEDGALCWNGANDRKAHGWDATCAVGAYPTGNTPSGLSDMAGNVWEWTASFDCPYDKTRPCAKTLRATRGGSWYDNTWTIIRSAGRGALPPTEEQFVNGFRCARDVRG